MIWEKMENLMPVEIVAETNQNNMENYTDQQAMTRNMKPTLWITGGNLSFWPPP